MTTKQKKVLDYMIKWAENEIRLNEYYDGDRHIKELAEKGMIAMYGVSDPLWYGMIEAGYSFKYTNDAAYGGEKGGYSWSVWDAIDPAFKAYFTDKYKNNR